MKQKIIDVFNIGIKTRNKIIERMRVAKIPDMYIAKVFGLHQSHIYHICGKASKFTFDRDRVAAIVHDLKTTDLPIRQIAIKHGVSCSTVRDHAATKKLRIEKKVLSSAELTRKYAVELAQFLKAFKDKHKRMPYGREYPYQLYRKCYVRNLLPQQKNWQ